MYYKEDFKTYLTHQGDYNFAIIDPPWNYNSKPYAVMNNQLTYSLWDNNDLHMLFNELKVDYVFLWVTNSFIPNVIDAIKDTDFIYKTLFTWVKTTSKGNIAYGLGNTFRNCTEQLVVLQKKKTKCLNLGIRNCILAKSGKRTAKPHDLEKQIVEKMAGKNMKGIYIFSGGELDFIDCVDVI